jgi:NADPH:quinone reductase-like Zn-dependent oxidoreductase
MPLRKELSLEQGATALANPITALAMIDEARREGHRAIVQTAAAGQLGRMIFGVANEAGMPTVNVVRRQAQADALRELGAAHVLVSERADFSDQLARACKEVQATVAFDAVGGEMTGLLAGALPDRSSVWVYGALSGRPCGGIDPMGLAFRHLTVRGFEIDGWLKDAGLFRSFMLALKAQRMVASGAVSTVVARRLGLDGARDGLLAYADSMSEGKVLLQPGAESPAPT